jgi:hypothetical protein
MSVQSQTPYNSYTANGATTVFPYTFLLLENGDLTVTVDGVVKTLTTDYTISGLGTPSGGNITFLSAPANGAKVLLSRLLTMQRLTDYQDNGDLFAETINRDLDRLWLALQQLQQNDIRALKLPYDTATDQAISEAAAARTGKLITFDASGNMILAVPADFSMATISAYMATLLDDADAAAARTTLGAGDANKADIQGQTATAVTSAGAAPAFTVTTSPAYGALDAGQRMRVKFHAAGTTGSNTLNRDGLGAKNLKQYDSTGAKVAAVVAANLLTDVEYDGTDMVILDPLPPAASTGGRVLQVVQAYKQDIFSTTSTSFVDVTGLSASITPSNVNNKVLVLGAVILANQTDFAAMQLVRGSTPIQVGTAAGSRYAATADSRSASDAAAESVAISYLDSPSATAATTYKVQVSAKMTGTTRVNSSTDDGDQTNRGRLASTLILMEIES